MATTTMSKDYRSGFEDCKQVMTALIDMMKDLEPASKRKVLESLRALKAPGYVR